MSAHIETLKELLDKVQDVQKEQTDTLKALLSQVSLIRNKYEQLEEIQATHFNIFSILHKEHDEVKLHSRFIAELLNPRAQHKQKDVFLRGFLATVAERDGFMTDDEIAQAEVQRERHHIDILIRTKQKAIIIENKIYARYGHKQLSPYRDAVERDGYSQKNIKLLYLTLYGAEVEESESEEVKEEVINVSYKDDITRWLMQCISQVALLPTMRETIQQYLQLVQKLTGQSLHQEETMEIKDLFLNNADYAKTFEATKGAFEDVKREVEQRFYDTLKAKLQDKGYDFKGTIIINHRLDYQWFPLTLFNLAEDQSFEAWVERYKQQHVYYGFVFQPDSKRQKSQTEEFSKFREIIKTTLNPAEENDWWIWFKHFEWGNDKIIECFDKATSDTLAEECVNEISSSIEKLKQAEGFKAYQWLV